MEDAAPQANIFVTATGNYHIINHGHMQAMKNNAIVCYNQPVLLLIALIEHLIEPGESALLFRPVF
jgi:hypothetical protein